MSIMLRTRWSSKQRSYFQLKVDMTISHPLVAAKSAEDYNLILHARQESTKPARERSGIVTIAPYQPGPLGANLYCHALSRKFPYAYSSRHMDIETADNAKLRNFQALINDLQILHWDPFTFFAQQQYGGFVREWITFQRQAGGRLLEADNVVAFFSSGPEPCQKVLRRKRRQ